MASFDGSLPMILYRALDAVMPEYRELFARHDVTEQQWRALRAVWSRERITSAALSEATLLSPPSLVSILDRLEAKGLVRRIRSMDDRREIHLVATEKGRRLYDEVLPKIARIHSRIRGGVTGAEWAEMERVLGKITREMKGRSQSRPKRQRACARQ